ncbi:MAG: hypothetical protein D6766_05805 [Verrucomicrobia bacterium]|nr:MAG: hypothetical protein D6766_05805 [Verrucomicrobiota bacterium]
MAADALVYWTGRLLVGGIQALPLWAVARLGRALGGLAWRLDARHRRNTLRNLRLVFGREQTEPQLRRLGLEHFRRVGENFACAIKTAAMSDEAIEAVLEVEGIERLRPGDPDLPPQRVMAIGHFGNFELYARAARRRLPFQYAATYRALKSRGFDRLLQELRSRSDCLFFERNTEGGALRRAMKELPLMIGFLSDQHAGARGLPVPFLGEVASTTPAPAVFAQRYRCPLHVAVCYRTGLARWRIEISPAIPTETPAGEPRPALDIMAEVNRLFEEAVRRDPANWFWAHRRWRPGAHRPLAVPEVPSRLP